MGYLFKENNQTELKEQVSKTFLKTVSAFANFQTGVIYFGVKDNGDVVGIKDVEKQKLQIENTINDSIHPIPKYKLVEHEMSGKTIIQLTVYKGVDTPYMYRNVAYMRADTASIPCDNYTLRNLLLAGMNKRYEELPYIGENLSFSVLEKSLQQTIALENLSLDVMKTLGLYMDGTYNNAAAFLADENIYTCCGIDMVRFGDTENIFLDRVTVDKQSLLTQYQAALAFFDKWYAPYEEVSGFYREKRIYIPREAFREAIANALCHRDFSINAKIRVACYKHRIEITSPGGLMDSLSEEEFLSGNISCLRNETVAEVFHRLDLIEKFATGIKRIKSEYSAFVEDAEFNIFPNTICITLPSIDYEKEANRSKREVRETNNETNNSLNETNKYPNDTNNLKNETKNETNIILSMEERRMKMLQVMQEDPEISIVELVDVFKVSRATITRDIKELKKQGLLERGGSRIAGTWITKNVGRI